MHMPETFCCKFNNATKKDFFLLLVDCFLKRFASAENRDLLCRDLNNFFGILGVAALTSSSLLDLKRTEAYDLYLIGLFQRSVNPCKYRINNFSCFLFGETFNRFCHCVYEICLCHYKHLLSDFHCHSSSLAIFTSKSGLGQVLKLKKGVFLQNF